jgi:hypothetical protein
MIPMYDIIDAYIVAIESTQQGGRRKAGEEYYYS